MEKHTDFKRLQFKMTLHVNMFFSIKTQSYATKKSTTEYHNVSTVYNKCLGGVNYFKLILFGGA